MQNLKSSPCNTKSQVLFLTDSSKYVKLYTYLVDGPRLTANNIRANIKKTCSRDAFLQLHLEEQLPTLPFSPSRQFYHICAQLRLTKIRVTPPYFRRPLCGLIFLCSALGYMKLMQVFSLFLALFLYLS